MKEAIKEEIESESSISSLGVILEEGEHNEIPPSPYWLHFNLPEQDEDSWHPWVVLRWMSVKGQLIDHIKSMNDQLKKVKDERGKRSQSNKAQWKQKLIQERNVDKIRE